MTKCLLLHQNKTFLQEELAAGNLQKYRQLQCALEDAEERADTAEGNLSRLRAKSRTAMSAAPSVH